MTSSVRPSVRERRPAPGPCARELELEVDGVVLSGLVALPPASAPRALIVAIHGHGMHAGYFDSQAAPGLSLLELAAATGYAVWAPDRPGIGRSTGLPDESLTLFAQADLLSRAVDAFGSAFPVGAGVVLVGHSYGLKVAWTMASRDDERRFLGVEGASSGITYAFEWGAEPTVAGSGRPARPVVDTWGPRSFYPSGALERDVLPTHGGSAVQRSEGPAWPAEIRSMGHGIEVPMRITFGDHETIWPLTAAHFEEMRSVFSGSPELEIAIEPSAAHNLSLGWAARAYHLRVLAFAERCVVARLLA